MKKAGTNIRIGAAVRTRREAQGYSQESYADMIRMHRAYYSAIERGERNITIRTLESICKGLGVKMWEVMKDAGD